MNKKKAARGRRSSPIEDELQRARTASTGSGLLSEGLNGASGAGVPAVGNASSVPEKAAKPAKKPEPPVFRSSQLDGLDGD